MRPCVAGVRPPPGPGAKRRGPVKAITESPSTLDNARAKLANACDDLDVAVQALSEGEGRADTVMASPGLVALLLRVVKARRQVNGLELVAAAETAEHRWLATRQ